MQRSQHDALLELPQVVAVDHHRDRKKLAAMDHTVADGGERPSGT
jgi:hypothetical protein